MNEVAPLTVATLYVLFVPLQTVALPLIAPGVAGTVFTVTESVCAEEFPQELVAVTLIVPLEPEVALIVFVVLVPLHPPGNVQV